VREFSADDGGLHQAKPQPAMVRIVSNWEEDCAVSGAGASPAPLTANLAAWQSFKRQFDCIWQIEMALPRFAEKRLRAVVSSGEKTYFLM